MKLKYSNFAQTINYVWLLFNEEILTKSYLEFGSIILLIFKGF